MVATTPAAFRAHIYRKAKPHYRALPWRRTANPYHILVSEIMLQQTQVDRVLPKYRAFLKRFPTIQALAHASLGDVLSIWQGLGYNRRAKLLRECARAVVAHHDGVLPWEFTALVALPGIGPYTAGAVLAFAYNIPHPIIETNIRTVYLHHFFPRARHAISERELLAHIERTLDRRYPRRWYTALMDYGAALKREHGNLNSRSKSYVRQSRFAGSARQVRGAIMRTLVRGACTTNGLARAFHNEGIPVTAPELARQLDALVAEGMVRRRGARFELAG